MHLLFSLPFASAMKLPGPIAFSFSGYAVYWSGIFLAIGVILAIFLAQYEAKRRNLPPDTAVDLCLIGIPLGIVGARLFYVFTNFPLFQNDLLRILYFWDGGLSFYGAFIGILVGIALYSRKKSLRFFELTDLLAPGLLLTQALALWSDFSEQTGFGPAVTAPSLQWFPFAVLIEESNSIHAAVFVF
jgi:phosphatidylglycerol:prolipoprotein diacylglycerol transferase